MLAAAALVACGQPDEPQVSVHRLDVGRCSSADRLVASAALIDDGLLATVAHPFDNADELFIDTPGGVRYEGRIVYLDEAKDIALIRLDQDQQQQDDEGVQAAELTDPAETGPVTVATAAGDGWPTDKPAEILDLVAVTMDGEGRRAAIKLEADIDPGDSGAPVVDEDGRMIGMVFATSRNSEVGWAVAAEEITAALDALAESGPQTISLSC